MHKPKTEANGNTKQYNDSIARLQQYENHMDSLRRINENLYDKYLRTICVYKGHVYDKCDDKNPYRKRIEHYNNGFLFGGSYTCANAYIDRRASINRKLIETRDSSYIMFYPDNIDKFCYRCNTYISIPQKPKYIKTVWKRF